MKLNDIISRAGEYAAAIRATAEAQAAFEAASRIARFAQETAQQTLRIDRLTPEIGEAVDAIAANLAELERRGANARIEPHKALQKAAAAQNQLAATLESDGLSPELASALVGIIEDAAPATQNTARIKAYLDRLGFPFEQ